MISRSVPSSTAPRSLTMGSDQLVERGAFGLTSGDPHHGAEGAQRGIGGVGVGRLGIIHPGDPMAFQHSLDLVRADRDRLQSFADRRRGHAVRAGQRGGCQRVGHIVRRGGTHIADLGEFQRRVPTLLDERSIDQQVIDHAQHRQSRRSQREADRSGTSTTSACSTICSVTGSATL